LPPRTARRESAREMAAKKTPRPDEIVSGPELGPVERTLGSMFHERAKRWPDRPALRYRSRSGGWTNLTWAQFDEKRRAIAAGLRELGVARGDIVAIVSQNSAEMLLAEAAILSLGAACAPIFPEYNAETLLG